MILNVQHTNNTNQPNPQQDTKGRGMLYDTDDKG